MNGARVQCRRPGEKCCVPRVDANDRPAAEPDRTDGRKYRMRQQFWFNSCDS
ncbi:hypothetical protein L839_4982 [Mycobacterium avium MAV_120809_2495]|nr:hypothetical protein L839_4982 [Mycobacterium avium MAV_120809_2495]